MGDLSVREAKAEDVDEILEVLRAALGETALLKRTPELWLWKHVHNPFGQSIVLLATVDDRIVGVRAFMRWELHDLDGHRLRCVRAVDTATHPDFQGRGVFRTLTEAAIDAARADGVDIVFNTPNEKSAPGYLKMGWGEVGKVTPLLRPRIGSAIRPEPDSIPDLQRVIPEARRFEAVDPIERAALGLRTPRSREYAEWRFGSHPFATYGLLDGPGGEVAVLRAGVRSGRTELLISDLFGPPSGGALRRALKAHKARYAAATFMTGPERQAAIEVGMKPLPRGPGLTLVANDLSRTGINLFDLDCWDFALSDLELL